MPLTDEQIAKMMQKEIKCKTVLVALVDKDKIVEQYKNEGWEFVSEQSCRDRIKLTFRKVK